MNRRFGGARAAWRTARRGASARRPGAGARRHRRATEGAPAAGSRSAEGCDQVIHGGPPIRADFGCRAGEPGVRRARAASAGSMEADAERDGVDAERARRLCRRQVLPGDEQQRLAVDLRRAMQCSGELGVEPDRFGRLETGLCDIVEVSVLCSRRLCDGTTRRAQPSSHGSGSPAGRSSSLRQAIAMHSAATLSGSRAPRRRA